MGPHDSVLSREVVAASGTAAVSAALLSVLHAGDEVIASRQLYGGSYRLLRDVFPRFGIGVRFVESDLAGIEKLASARTKSLYIETPTNPTLRVVDLKRAASLAHSHKLLSLIDSTFATPINQRPAEYGLDLVLHSGTKYLGGHADLTCGVVAGPQHLLEQNTLVGDMLIDNPEAVAARCGPTTCSPRSLRP